MSDEQRVRTMCGWIGVEISRSRVRTPGKAGYGLWRVRGSVAPARPVRHCPKCGEPAGFIEGQSFCERCGWQSDSPTAPEWTAYAFTLEEIETAARGAIKYGQPSGPDTMRLSRPADPTRDDARRVLTTVPTRWTSAYRGRRDLGCGSVEGELAGWDEMRRPPVGEGLTVRQRQRAANAEFQAAHTERRRYGKAAYHAMRLANAQPVDLPVHPDEH